MSDEPNYEYVKGYGWMPLDCPTRTVMVGPYQVTLIERKPEIGEYHLYEYPEWYKNIDHQTNRIKTTWFGNDMLNGVDPKFRRYGELDASQYEREGVWVTIRWERVG